MKKTLSAIFLLCCSILTAQVKIGNNPTQITPSAELEIESTTKGFLSPRMTTEQRNAIINPAIGLIIFNVSTDCLNFFIGTHWVDICGTPHSGIVSSTGLGSSFTIVPQGLNSEAFSNNQVCADKTISVTPCTAVPEAVLNDDLATTLGKEYDWLANAGNEWMQGGANRALVEINGQCWYRRNAGNAHTQGNSYYSNQQQHPDEGRLYNWTAAMNGVNGSAAERAQGICPEGWHVPSDCEWMFLEHSLGMDIQNQVKDDDERYRGVGTGAVLSDKIQNGSNISGFSVLLAGMSDNTNITHYRERDAYFYTSTNGIFMRKLRRDRATGIERYKRDHNSKLSVRCLKD